MNIIDLRKPDLRIARVRTIVITSKDFQWELLSREEGKEVWKDLTSGLIWKDIEDQKYTYDEALEIFKNSLPAKEEFEIAEKHGIREVLPNMCDWFWSSSVNANNTDFARYFNGYNGYIFNGNRDDKDAVLCCSREGEE